jgi:hypothetical protein
VGTVSHRIRDDGTHEIGVTIDKAFVPFAEHSEARVAQLVENATQREERESESGDKEGGK